MKRLLTDEGCVLGTCGSSSDTLTGQWLCQEPTVPGAGMKRRSCPSTTYRRGGNQQYSNMELPIKMSAKEINRILRYRIMWRAYCHRVTEEDSEWLQLRPEVWEVTNPVRGIPGKGNNTLEAWIWFSTKPMARAQRVEWRMAQEETRKTSRGRSQKASWERNLDFILPGQWEAIGEL